MHKAENSQTHSHLTTIQTFLFIALSLSLQLITSEEALALPTVDSIVVNSGIIDPPNRRGLNGEVLPQPTSWSQQRSYIRNFVVKFSEPVYQLNAEDVLLVNLGVDVENDPDTIIPLTPDHITLDGTRAIFTFAPAHRIDPGTPYDLSDDTFVPAELPDGVYALHILSALFKNGTEIEFLDGNGDGIPCGEFVFEGSAQNSFYRLEGDFNGDFRVELQTDDKPPVFLDLRAFRYWFGELVEGYQPLLPTDPQGGTAPQYVDLNGDGADSIFDHTVLVNNNGNHVIFGQPSITALTPNICPELPEPEPQPEREPDPEPNPEPNPEPTPELVVDPEVPDVSSCTLVDVSSAKRVISQNYEKIKRTGTRQAKRLRRFSKKQKDEIGRDGKAVKRFYNRARTILRKLGEVNDTVLEEIDDTQYTMCPAEISCIQVSNVTAKRNLSQINKNIFRFAKEAVKKRYAYQRHSNPAEDWWKRTERSRRLLRRRRVKRIKTLKRQRHEIQSTINSIPDSACS